MRNRTLIKNKEPGNIVDCTIFYNQKDGSRYVPLKNLGSDQAEFSINDSLLHEKLWNFLFLSSLIKSIASWAEYQISGHFVIDGLTLESILGI
mgnify:CR=1 FL=1